MAILQMVQSPGRIVSGSIELGGTNIVGMSEAQLRHVRWRKLSLIPQGAMNSLNPVMYDQCSNPGCYPGARERIFF